MELFLGEPLNHKLSREMDDQTGFDELVIKKWYFIEWNRRKIQRLG